jgi:lysophospholipid acyltransferase (LPLAT)-like uncharacterized protein
LAGLIAVTKPTILPRRLAGCERKDALMKIRRPWVIKSLCLIGYWLVRALVSSVYSKYWRFGRDLRPSALQPNERCIYALWHEYLLVPMVRFSHPSARLLISHHTDGLIVAEMCKHLRMGVVRGSKRHGGFAALRCLLRPGRYRSVAVTPDGPVGPRRRVKLGIIFLASNLGWPIVPIGVGYRRPWRLRSWDRFAIPRPYQPAAFVTAEPISVPAGLSREELEVYRQELEDTLHALTEQAETAARSGRRPALPAPARADETHARAA